MRRWNGWGDDQFSLELPKEGQAFLDERIGQGQPLSDATLEAVCAGVPESRISPASEIQHLVDLSPETRVRHARGQSLPDWLAMRSGDIGRFPDGVALPRCNEDVQALLSYARNHGVQHIVHFERRLTLLQAHL